MQYKNQGPLEPTIGALGKKGEPISLAEEIALEQSLKINDPLADDPFLIGDSSYWQELQQLSLPELIAEARSYGESDIDDSADRSELVFRVIKQRIRQSGQMFFEGSLEILPDEFGFLRSPDNYYQSRPDDIYVSPSQIRRFAIRNGSKVSGQIRPPKMNERYFALLHVEAINHQDPNRQRSQPSFEEMVSIPPDEPLRLPPDDFAPSLRDAISSLNYGSACLITGSAEKENTLLMQRLVKSALTNDPNLFVLTLFLDKTEEEMRIKHEELQGARCEVIGTYLGETVSRYVHLTDFMLEKAKRMVEYGKNVLFCLDSLNSLTKSKVLQHNEMGQENSLRLLHTARKTEKGSLTIIATTTDDFSNPENSENIQKQGIVRISLT